MPREVVKRFADAMEAVLQQNDYKGGWGIRDCSIEYLEERLTKEVDEYFKSEHLKKKELIDIANFAMMIWSRLVSSIPQSDLR